MTHPAEIDFIPRYMTPAQARRYVGCRSPRTFKKYSVYLKVIKLPDGAIRFDKQDIDRFMHSCLEDAEDQVILERLSEKGI